MARRGLETSPYQMRRDAKRLSEGCERCEGELLKVMADFVDGLHRVARGTPRVRDVDWRLEQAASRYFDGHDYTREAWTELAQAIREWQLKQREQSELEMARLRALSVVTGDFDEE